MRILNWGPREVINMQTETLRIGGMTCAACSARVERALRKLEGIENATVNLATEKATVVYNPRSLQLSSIKEAIQKAGYEVLEPPAPTLSAAGVVDEDKLRKEKEIKTLKIKFIVASSLALPLLYIAMAPMIGLPFPVKPMRFPLAYALTQLALVIPIIIAGNKFYTVGFKNLFHGSPNMDSLIAIGTSAAFIYSVYSNVNRLRKP